MVVLRMRRNTYPCGVAKQFASLDSIGGLDRQTLKTLPRMRSMPGTYSAQRFFVSEKILLIDREAAHQAGIDLYGSSVAMESYTALVLTRKQREYTKRAVKDRRARRPEPEDPHDSHEENPLRFMAIFRTPWLKKPLGSLNGVFTVADALSTKEGISQSISDCL